MSDDLCMRIWGGLGNQMFQYAAGLALSRRLGCGLVLHAVETRPAHARFALDVFGLDLRLWQPDARDLPLLDRLRGKASGKRAAKAWPGPVFEQQGVCATDGIETVRPGTYLAGFFQSEEFFADQADAVRAAFALDRFAEGIDPALLAAAEGPATASVHIRRGDYAADPQTTATHGLLGAEHYARARALTERLVPVERWLVFSDDADAAAALTEGWPGRIVVTGQTPAADMALMARCAHHVIANSSFSWWAAWLGRNPDRTVIAPRHWFSVPEMKRCGYVDGLCPVGWVLV